MMAQVTGGSVPIGIDKQQDASGTFNSIGSFPMTPLTPFVESPTGRLTELVYLLSDRPLSLVHEGGDIVHGDPWLVVASALQRLSTMTEATLWARHQQRRLTETTTEERELVVS
jgi:hypothetical protein